MKKCQYDNCERPIFGGSYCLSHQYCRTDKAPPKTRERKKINLVSKKRREENKIYAIERQKFLQQHPLCKANLNGCTQIATEIHHMQGRTGANFLDISTWLSVCGNCHRIIELNPQHAKQLGLSRSRLK